MAASALPAPGSALSAEALWREHLHHRAASRARRQELASLASSLAPLLRAQLLADPAAYPAWLASLAIPAPSAAALTKLPPVAPAFALARLQLTISLTPLDADVTGRALSLLAQTLPPGGFDPGAVVADALIASTHGDLRNQLRLLRARDPLDFNPKACAALALRYPANPPRPAPLAAPTPPSDDLVRSLFTRFAALRRAHRREARELSRRLSALGLLLAQKQHELAAPGRSSRFGAWLRQYRIPRRTAYRLMEKFAPANCAGSTPPPAPPLTLRPHCLSVRLTPQQAAIVHRALWVPISRSPSAPSLPPLARLIISAFLNLLPPNAGAPLFLFWDSGGITPPPANPMKSIPFL